ncbi:unnamed protein product, partial [Aphanomyces euteiches]
AALPTSGLHGTMARASSNPRLATPCDTKVLSLPKFTTVLPSHRRLNVPRQPKISTSLAMTLTKQTVKTLTTAAPTVPRRQVVLHTSGRHGTTARASSNPSWITQRRTKERELLPRSSANSLKPTRITLATTLIILLALLKTAVLSAVLATTVWATRTTKAFAGSRANLANLARKREPRLLLAMP